MEGRPSSSGSVVFYPDASGTHIYPPRCPTLFTRTRPSSNSTVIVHKESPPTVTHPNLTGTEQVRSFSSGTVIIHPDAPRTIIYPPRQQDRAGLHQSKVASSNRDHKRKYEELSHPSHDAIMSKTSALVVLLQRTSFAMATDFAAFKHEFDYHGVHAEYLSIVDLEVIIRATGPLLYRRDDNPKRPRVEVLSADHEKFYKIISNPRKMKNTILRWLRNAVRRSKEGESIALVSISHDTQTGSVIIGGEWDAATVDYLTKTEVRAAVANLSDGTYLTIINTCCYSGD